MLVSLELAYFATSEQGGAASGEEMGSIERIRQLCLKTRLMPSKDA